MASEGLSLRGVVASSRNLFAAKEAEEQQWAEDFAADSARVVAGLGEWVSHPHIMVRWRTPLPKVQKNKALNPTPGILAEVGQLCLKALELNFGVDLVGYPMIKPFPMKGDENLAGHFIYPPTSTNNADSAFPLEEMSRLEEALTLLIKYPKNSQKIMGMPPLRANMSMAYTAVNSRSQCIGFLLEGVPPALVIEKVDDIASSRELTCDLVRAARSHYRSMGETTPAGLSGPSNRHMINACVGCYLMR